MQDSFIGNILLRIVDIEEARIVSQRWSTEGQKIVFTNGCFDILHPGHIQYLSEAAELGHRLIIGLNSDASVKRLKGEGRPIKDQEARAILLASLRMVDMVVIFEEDTPYHLIQAILPDVLVKGGDWKIEEIVGSDIVLGHNGEVKSLSYLEGASTTEYIRKIKNT